MFDGINLDNLLGFVDTSTIPGQLFVSYALNDKTMSFPSFGELLRIEFYRTPRNAIRPVFHKNLQRTSR